jgi:hypothetical protein
MWKVKIGGIMVMETINRKGLKVRSMGFSTISISRKFLTDRSSYAVHWNFGTFEEKATGEKTFLALKPFKRVLTCPVVIEKTQV